MHSVLHFCLQEAGPSLMDHVEQLRVDIGSKVFYDPWQEKKPQERLDDAKRQSQQCIGDREARKRT